jgi:mevalonate kinase
LISKILISQFINYYAREKNETELSRELEFLKSMWQLPFRPAANLNHFFLINTGKPVETTGEMVAIVRNNYEKDRTTFENIFNENEKQTKRVAAALKEGDEETLMDAIQKGEKTLEEMGVVSDSVKKLINEIENEHGAAKILGGGGKKGSVGFVLCYHHDPEKIKKLCVSYGYEIKNVTLGEEGVRLEKK